MKRIFTLKSFAFLCLVLFLSVRADSQTNANPNSCTNSRSVCNINVTSDFSTGADGFTGSGQDPLFSYNSTGQNLQTGGNTPTATKQNQDYTITSKAYTAQADAKVGFTLGGTGIVETITINVISAVNSVILSTCQINPYNIAGGSVCFTISDLDLENQSVKFKIILHTQNPPNGGKTGILSFDDFRVRFGAQGTLPVSFTGFEGRKTSKGTELLWKVAAERNVKAYEIERSTWGNSGFATIGSVPATSSSSYSFTDEASANGAVFYRIRNVDNDGSSRYSTVLHFKNGAGSVLFKVVPTVVVNKTSVQHPLSTGTALITLSTADGKLVRSLRPAVHSVQTDVDLSGLRAGLYLLKWSDGAGAVETTKLVKQ